MIWYPGSFLASVVSIAGCAAAIFGVTMLKRGDVGTGVIAIVIGAALVVLGKVIADN